MMTDLQSQYMDEVLGVRPGPTDGPVPASVLPLIVECEEVTEFTKALLHKIMASVGIPAWAQILVNEEAPQAKHRLQFVGLGGRAEKDGQVEWRLPTLTEMLGDGPEVAQKKKAAWSLLKDFQVEFNRC